jgi:DNA-directed RNA polymerase subunit K/omega
MTYIPRREITNLIPNKFEAIRVLALECRRLNDEIRAREDGECEGKLTTLAVSQMLAGKVTYYDAKERREQERSEAMLSAAEGLLDIAEPMMEPDLDEPVEEAAPVDEAASAEASVLVEEAAPVEESVAAEVEAVAEEAPVDEPAVEEAPVAEAPAAEAQAEEAQAEAVTEAAEEIPLKESPGA